MKPLDSNTPSEPPQSPSPPPAPEPGLTEEPKKKNQLWLWIGGIILAVIIGLSAMILFADTPLEESMDEMMGSVLSDTTDPNTVPGSANCSATSEESERDAINQAIDSCDQLAQDSCDGTVIHFEATVTESGTAGRLAQLISPSPEFNTLPASSPTSSPTSSPAPSSYFATVSTTWECEMEEEPVVSPEEEPETSPEVDLSYTPPPFPEDVLLCTSDEQCLSGHPDQLGPSEHCDDDGRGYSIIRYSGGACDTPGDENSPQRCLNIDREYVRCADINDPSVSCVQLGEIEAECLVDGTLLPSSSPLPDSRIEIEVVGARNAYNSCSELGFICVQPAQISARIKFFSMAGHENGIVVYEINSLPRFIKVAGLPSDNRVYTIRNPSDPTYRGRVSLDANGNGVSSLIPFMVQEINPADGLPYGMIPGTYQVEGFDFSLQIGPTPQPPVYVTNYHAIMPESPNWRR